MYQPHLSGAYCENRAAEYLQNKGFKIITRNYRSKFGEIDIVAKESDIFVFVEVRYRSDNSFLNPEDSVDLRKLKRIKKTAEMFLIKNEFGVDDVYWRIDVIAISGPLNDLSCEHYIDVFESNE